MTYEKVPEHGIEILAGHWRRGENCDSVSCSAIRDEIFDKGVLAWYDVIITDPELARTWLESKFGFSSVAVEHAVSRDLVSTFVEGEDSIYMSFSRVRTTKGDSEFMQVSVFLGLTSMITIHTEPSDTLQKWFEKWVHDPESVGPNAASLLENLMDEVLDDFHPALDEIEAALDDLEVDIYEGRPIGPEEILGYKRRLIGMRRKVSPLRDLVNSLLRRDIKVIPPEEKPGFQDLYDHAIRLLERVELLRDLLADLMDARITVLSNNLNMVMKTLTIISTMLMTIGVFTGWYGMNFKHMPELASPVAYGALPVLIAIVLALEYWFFKRKGWV